MKDIISDLYHGEIHPAERKYPSNSDARKLLVQFGDNEDWLTEHLEGTAKDKLLELVNCHDELDGITAYDSFREGFFLGAQMIIFIMEGGDNYGTT